MSRSRSRLACALLILLLAVPSWAAPVREARGADPLSLFARLWETIVEIWEPSEEGCMIDPHGGCRPPAPAPTSDEGCGMDPHGGCKPGS